MTPETGDEPTNDDLFWIVSWDLSKFVDESVYPSKPEAVFGEVNFEVSSLVWYTVESAIFRSEEVAVERDKPFKPLVDKFVSQNRVGGLYQEVSG
jgi:hypothetical protein